MVWDRGPIHDTSGLVRAWLTAALWGRLLCRRALTPITKMAASARSVRRTAADGSLLEVAPGRDELEDLGRAFNDLLADLRASLDRQHRFTGDASHQLRTPLTAMLASVEVALRQVRSPAEYQRVLSVVRRRGVQLRQIIESLLFLARAESDCHLPDTETVDLPVWCRSWLDSWADHARAGDLVVQTGEAATQELLVAVAANRAYNTVLYRQRKWDVLEDTIKLNKQVVEQVKKLADLGRLRPADLIVAQTELDAAGAQLGQGRTAIAFARADLRRQFGTRDDSFAVKGELDLPLPTTAFEPLAEAALEKRPDLQSRKLAVAEAQARLNLQVADRYGNPNFGPLFDYNETKNAFYGIQIGGPIPVFNQKRGEILQAIAGVRQFEV